MGIERAGFLSGCKVSLSCHSLYTYRLGLHTITKSDYGILQERVTAAGYAFISADYRLIPPANAHDIIDDIKDVFRFIREELNVKLSEAMPSLGSRTYPRYHVDPNAIAVAGSSAGGQCALYAAMHVSPKPKAVVTMYAMGGDYLVRAYIARCNSNTHHIIPDSTISDREDSAVLQRPRDPRSRPIYRIFLPILQFLRVGRRFPSLVSLCFLAHARLSRQPPNVPIPSVPPTRYPLGLYDRRTRK